MKKQDKHNRDEEDGQVLDAGDLPGVDVPSNPSFISRLLFLFIDPLVHYGYKNTLQPSDTMRLHEVDTEPLYDKFATAWKRQQDKPKPDIRIAVFGGFWGPLLYTGILYAVSLASQLVGPMMLQQIVGGLSCFSAQEAGQPVQCASKQHLYL